MPIGAGAAPVVKSRIIPDFHKLVMESAKDAGTTRAIKWSIVFAERIKGRDIARAEGRFDLLALVPREGNGVIYGKTDVTAVVPVKTLENNLSGATPTITFKHLTMKELVIWMGCSFGDQINGSRNAGTRGMLTTKSGGEVAWCDLSAGDTRLSYGKVRTLVFLI